MTVGVFGLGRFGSFWSGLLSERFSVLAYDRDPDIKAPQGVRRANLDELGQCPIVFLCVTIRALPEVLQVLGPYLAKDTIVADTCSVKVLPGNWMLEHLPPHTPILATHPMFGPESAKDGLEGLAIMMDPLRLDEKRTQFWEDVFAGFGLSVVRMTCDQHDREAAYSQALTHFVGRSLYRIGLPETPIATRWYKKLHGVARQCVRDSHLLFEDMQTLNPYAAEMRRKVLQGFADTLQDLGDPLVVQLSDKC
ncbi:prephenate dehydrogenase/arogenate dehydrogenase family protein [Gracilinema caldarium]|uniref:prephenate dehydrogenase/arogenate dehydrogenase family protein n=1 Tax=Gracilinema caldarium TaxID=215591 RepID=UPI0026E9A0CC|nr:prephenate dehydrogenase/arogenate dehydrogenase family protein [Gracilinema caldarium]